MGRLTIVLLLALCIFIATVEGGKKNKGEKKDKGEKKNKGGKKGKEDGGCSKRDEKTLAGCLKNGKIAINAKRSINDF